MIGREVEAQGQDGSAVTATILDKVLMTKSHFDKKAVMNEASFHVYIGKTTEGNIVLFRPDWITHVF